MKRNFLYIVFTVAILIGEVLTASLHAADMQMTDSLAVDKATGGAVSANDSTKSGIETDSVGLPTKADTAHVLTKKELHKLKVAKRNFHYNILGGPSYTPDLGLLIGGSALMTFRVNAKDTTLKRSVVPMSIAVMIKGGASFQVKPQLFFKGDRFRIFGQFSYKNTLDNYYGVGFNTNKDYVRSDTTSQFRYSGFQFNPHLLFRLGKSNFFAGPQVDITFEQMINPARGIVKDPSYLQAGGDKYRYSNFSSGLGFLVNYDSRDVPANAYKGVYFDFRAMMYEKFFGSQSEFYKLDIDYRQYVSVGKRKVLAWTVQSKNVFGNNVPLNKYNLPGTPFDLRGYYMGQFRDKSAHIGIVEYRQMVNTDMSTKFKRLVSRLGFVAWGGCGFMGPNPTKIEGVLPNVGLGIRIEVQPRMNIRLDLGRDFVNKQNLFYFNMTEAF